MQSEGHALSLALAVLSDKLFLLLERDVCNAYIQLFRNGLLHTFHKRAVALILQMRTQESPVERACLCSWRCVNRQQLQMLWGHCDPGHILVCRCPACVIGTSFACYCGLASRLKCTRREHLCCMLICGQGSNLAQHSIVH